MWHHISSVVMKKRNYSHKLILHLCAFAVLFLGLWSPASATDQSRIWTSQEGHQVRATLVKVWNDRITIKREDGRTVYLLISALSYGDQAYLRELQTQKPESSSIQSKSVDAPSIAGALSRYEDLSDLARQARRIAGLPALGVCIIRDYKIHGVGYAHSKTAPDLFRSAGPSDQISIASCTKAMNATLAAVLVSKGKIDWSSTLSEVFPELTKEMDRRYRDVTIEQLLNHTAGAPSMNDFWKSKDYQQVLAFSGSAQEQRLELIKVVTAHDPIFKPGTEFEYSNVGHYIAGAMLERVMSDSWESLIETLVIEPLGLSHTTPYPPDEAKGIMNPQFTAPGGGIYSTLEDFAKFSIFHMQFQPNNPLGITRDNFEKLHQASDIHHYGLGLYSIHRNWSSGVILQHNGRDRLAASTFWLAPEEGFGVFVVTPGQYPDSKFWDDSIPFIIKEFN